MQNESKSKTVWVVVGIIFILAALAGIAYAERAPLYNQLNAWKLIPEPEKFTELYFNDASSLPRHTVAGAPISFSFTVHNLEGATTTYPYRVYFQYPFGEEVSIATSSITLGDNASASTTISYKFLASDETGMVVVDLTSIDQSIDFLLPNTNY